MNNEELENAKTYQHMRPSSSRICTKMENTQPQKRQNQKMILQPANALRGTSHKQPARIDLSTLKAAKKCQPKSDFGFVTILITTFSKLFI